MTRIGFYFLSKAATVKETKRNFVDMYKPRSFEGRTNDARINLEAKIYEPIKLNVIYIVHNFASMTPFRHWSKLCTIFIEIRNQSF